MLAAVADPLASVAIWEIEVDVGDTVYVMPKRDTVSWLSVLLESPFDIAAVVPGLLSDDDQETLEEALLDGGITADMLHEAAKHAITVASGRDWWWTLRFAGVLRSQWPLLFGPLAAAGVKLAGLPLGAFLDATYHQATTFMNKEQRREFDRELEMPPPGEVPEVDERQEEANFLALMNQGV